MLLSAYGFDTGSRNGVPVADPTRVAAEIVSGIGFLGAGVILRDGLTVRGLNTAATLWCSAAIGAFAGAGMDPIAALGTTAVICANVVLRPLGRRLDRHPTGGDETTVDYHFEAVCAEPTEAHIRALLVGAITGTQFQLRGIRSYNTDTDHQVSVIVELTTEQRNDRQLEQAVSRLSSNPPSPPSPGPCAPTPTPPTTHSTAPPPRPGPRPTGDSAHRSPATETADPQHRQAQRRHGAAGRRLADGLLRTFQRRLTTTGPRP